MASFNIEVTGMDELINNLEKLGGAKAREFGSLGLYEGAGVVADKVSTAIRGIATEPFKFAKGGRKRKPSPEEKAILMNAKHGVAKFRFDGNTVDTSVGLQNSGYGAIEWNHARSTNSRTLYKMDKNGRAVHASKGEGKAMKPVPLIANAINSGTSFMEKQPFLRQAFSTSKAPAIAKIESKIKEELEKIEL